MSSCDGPIKSEEPIWQIAELDKGGRAIWGTSSDDAWVVDDDYFYHWDGSAWTAFDVPYEVSDSVFFAVWGSGPDDYWAGGTIDGGLLHWDGSQWSFVPTPTFYGPGYALSAVMDIWGSSADDVWAVGELGKVMHWDGTAWEVYDIGFFDHSINSESFYGIYGRSSDDIWMVGTNLSIFHWDGSSWEKYQDDARMLVDLEKTITLRDVWADNSASDAYIVGDSGLVLYLIFAPELWMEFPGIDASSSLETIWGENGSWIKKWTAGRWGDSGLNYCDYTYFQCESVHNPAKPRTLYSIWGSSYDNIWAVGNDVILHYDYFYLQP